MKKILMSIILVPFLLLTLSSRAFAMGYNESQITPYFENFIGCPSEHYCTLIYANPRYPSGATVCVFKFSDSFTINPKTFTYTGTLIDFCYGEYRNSSSFSSRSSGLNSVSYWSSYECNPDEFIVYGIAGGTDTSAYTDNFDFFKSDNEMKMCLWLDAEFNKSRTYDWWATTDLYKVTFDVNFNGNTYNIPILFYPQFLIDIGQPAAQYGTNGTDGYLYPKWLEDYFKGSTPDISGFGKIFQDYPVKGYKTYSTDYYRNTAFLYNRSDGTKMWLTAWTFGNVSTAPDPDGTPLNFDIDDLTHYYYNNTYDMYPPMGTSSKVSNGSGISEFLEFYLSDIKDEMIARVPTFTTNDLYKCTYTVKCYGANKPGVIAYSKTLDWSEYVDMGIAPPIMQDSSNKRNYFAPPDTQDLSDNGTDSTRAPSPFAVNTSDTINGVKISDFTFQEFTPSSADLSMVGDFFAIFTDSPFGIVLLLALTFLVIKTLIW